MDKEYDQDDIKKKFNKFLKSTLQFVLSVSVFSFFVWYSSGFSILPQCFNAYFSSCLFSMLTRTLERKYMFLICNAILALLAMSPHFDLRVSEEPLGAFRLLENAPLMVEEEAKRHEEYPDQHISQAEENEGRLVSKVSNAEEEGAGGGTGSSTGVIVAQDDDELVAETAMEMETNEELENTDELNRKIEEFIRKMKEEMRIEAQKQPIAV